MRAGVLVVTVLVSANVAFAGRWTVNGSGECVREWTPSSLARGPLGMTNAITFPGRQLVGGGQAAYDEPSRSTAGRVILVPTLALLGLGSGIIEGGFVMGKGMADFVTGGAFDLVSDESADVSLSPMTPAFLASPVQTPTTDPCGRSR